MTRTILADIGGTNTRVALADGVRIRVDSIRRFSNAHYKARGSDICAILSDYLADCGETIERVCVAAAGPVRDNVAVMTNLDWKITPESLRQATGAEHVAILNDLQAQGLALEHIANDKLRVVMPGTRHEGSSMLVVGLGTGVNAAPVHRLHNERIVVPSECGHVSIAVRCDEDFRLMRFIETLLSDQNGPAVHCGIEEVLSGRGLENLYRFALHEAGKSGEATSSEIISALEAQQDPIAQHAAQLYTRLLGESLADWSLIHLPYDGIFLIGGMARIMAPYLQHYGLEKTFRQKRRIDLLENNFSIHVVEDDYAALVGCAAYFA